MLPTDLALSAGSLAAPLDTGEIHAGEAAAMRHAVPKRRAEFFAGRIAAHRAMQALGHPPAPVLMGEDRAPIWPEGLVGSISHCRDACVALVARAAQYRSLAVDIEPDSDLPEDVIELVCLPEERLRLARLPEAERARMARLIFSAKEATYKLQYPVAGKPLEFSDVEIVVDVLNKRFEAHVAPPLAPAFATQVLTGRFGRAEGKLFCVMLARP